MPIVRAKYAPGLFDYDGGYQEVRWDLSGCNLSCLFCWSPASRPEGRDPTRILTSKDVAVETLRNMSNKSRAFIRFTGGEPTLQWRPVTGALKELQLTIKPPRPPILFQTNGIAIGKGVVVLDALAGDKDQHYLFELSFKGTNADEFALLTGKPAELYEHQLTAYQRLAELSRTAPNIAVVAVLGVYHSATRRPSKYAFVNPQSGKLLFEDVEAWDPRFSIIWQAAHRKWVERLRMSPPGLWRNVLKRCGPDGAGILRSFPSGTPTNQNRLFPAKPQSGDYARQIVLREFWQ